MEFLDLRNEVCAGQEFTPVQEPTDPLDHDLGCGFGGTFRQNWRVSASVQRAGSPNFTAWRYRVPRHPPSPAPRRVMPPDIPGLYGEPRLPTERLPVLARLGEGGSTWGRPPPAESG